jgi:hypothetical protein
MVKNNRVFFDLAAALEGYVVVFDRFFLPLLT